jgi:type II secretory pathway component PulF
MLLVVSQHYDGEVSRAIERSTQLINPIVLIVMGGVTLFIVWAMMSAVFSVNEIIG